MVRPGVEGPQPCSEKLAIPFLGARPAAPSPATILAIALHSTSIATLKIGRLLFTFMFALLPWWAFFAGIFAPATLGYLLDFTLLVAGVNGVLVMIPMNRPNAGVMG
jgi:hypothetical protein